MSNRPYVPAHLSASAMCAKLMLAHAEKHDNAKGRAKRAARRMAHEIAMARLSINETRMREAARLLNVRF